jgi:hypothetical protein
MSGHFYQILANGVLLAHFGLVLFIIGGLILTLLGGRYRWHWVRNFWFRSLHLAAIGYVMAESWLGIDCALTTLEQWLRARAGQARYDDDFIAHWLGSILFFQAPDWVFTTVYSAFALLVAISWISVRPARWRKRGL